MNTSGVSPAAFASASSAAIQSSCAAPSRKSGPPVPAPQTSRNRQRWPRSRSAAGRAGTRSPAWKSASPPPSMSWSPGMTCTGRLSMRSAVAISAYCSGRPWSAQSPGSTTKSSPGRICVSSCTSTDSRSRNACPSGSPTCVSPTCAKASTPPSLPTVMLAPEEKKESSFSEEKEAKRLCSCKLRMWSAVGARPAKVFCFFFSKKKRLPSFMPRPSAAPRRRGAPRRPGRPTARSRPGRGSPGW